ncbi:glycosyltransferase family 2 protein [Candidatus Roizmanbacteria bacterium]|nr:glycosyltransferase family 2 protein [Candidatus Roizmanbacteria bacterium]
MAKLTVALATFNEEKNLGNCLDSVKGLADEIVIVDGSSTDKTVEIAKSFNAKTKVVENQAIFHINKQKALDMASNEWILQLDADEIVSPQLAKEIAQVIAMTQQEREAYQEKLPKRKLFLRHQALLEARDGNIGTKEGNYAAFFVPRLNFFMGKYLRFGGVYPDGVIRLIKKDLAKFPCKDVHEQIVVEGRVGWLENDLIHMADPTFKRYIERNNRYIDLIAKQLADNKTSKDLLTFGKYTVSMPLWWFLLTFVRHKGFKDSWQGFVFSFFSALRFPRAYFRYLSHS